MEVNLFEDSREFEIPIYFMEGRYDYNAPSIIASKYFDSIKAPDKELIWFEDSAHFHSGRKQKDFTEY